MTSSTGKEVVHVHGTLESKSMTSVGLGFRVGGSFPSHHSTEMELLGFGVRGVGCKG